jgi:outer membrane lipoprotein-sorting protein
MEKDRIEEVLKKLGSEDVPADVRQIAEEKAEHFRGQLYEQKSNFQLRDIIMKRKVLGFSIAAAVIVIAFCIGISFIGGTSGVALADVLQKVEQAQAFMYKLKMNMTGNMQPGMPAGESRMEGAITISTEYGMKMDMDMNTNIGGNVRKMRQLMYIVPEEKKIYMITPEQKQYIQMEFSDDILARIKKQSNDPRETLKQILNSKYTDIGKSEINGVEVEGFQTTDPAYAGGSMEDLKVVLWVDVKTWLPVRMEMNMKVNEQTKMEGVMEDFQWNVPVDAGQFVPVIPQDYTTPLPGGYKLPSISEESAIDGLKFSGQLLGRYPKKIDMMNLMNEIVAIKDSNNPTEAALKLKETLQGQVSKLPQEEQTQKILEIMKPVQSLGMFYMTLVQEKKEPAYYGNVVGPSDADKVLLRWKTGDNEYRVIYGNLTAETVSAERLAELESKIPK